MAFDLHKAVREFRKRAGLTQTQLAERSGASQSTISQLENGQGNVTLQMLQAIGAVLGFDVRIASPVDDTVQLGELSPEDRAMVRQFIEALPKMNARERFAMLAELESYDRF